VTTDDAQNPVVVDGVARQVIDAQGWQPSSTR
jgi:hypothetical protein